MIFFLQAEHTSMLWQKREASGLLQFHISVHDGPGDKIHCNLRLNPAGHRENPE